MADSDSKNLPSSSTPSSSSSKVTSTEINNRSSHNHSHSNNAFSSLKGHFPNPPDATNPDPATLREQWRFAIRQYSRWYSQAWGTAILAGFSFFALGWIIKGSNPLPSLGGQSSPVPDDKAANNDGEK